ncbi:MAG: pyridoxal-dependent decarboxylase [Nitriliruptorales bacterium]|nr:pyridoxal-dependent decarboxylase [Nitriliruptorales bacterium]
MTPDPAHDSTGDMPPAAFREHGYAVVDRIASYLEEVGELPVLSPVEPGWVADQLPATPPSDPESMEQILADVDAIVVPGLTHWNHPAFHAYFAITGSGPGILGEALTAAFNVNGMLWRTSPAATELEQVTLDWLRQLLELPAGFAGVIMDTASMATLVALAAAREAAGLQIRTQGMAGRADLPPLAIYASTETHSSIEKAAITLGLGQRSVRKVDVDEAYRMDPGALRHTMLEDLRAGVRPLAVVPTVGTTATTSIDPVTAIADVRDEIEEELGGKVWLHVDGAYGGLAAICEEHRHVLDGVERADSFVTNPHKWLFTPIDCSAFYVRDPDVLTTAFSLVPDYLETTDHDVTNYMDWGVQLGRRFRALKLWMVIRWFGADGLAARIREHVRLAGLVVDWVEQHPDLELAAPAPFSTVCFRAALDDHDDLDALNAALMERVNRSGRAYLSHTVLDGRYTLRLAIGNLRTTEERLRDTLALVDEHLADLA